MAVPDKVGYVPTGDSPDRNGNERLAEANRIPYRQF
jgi:hypothetical protein